MNESDVFLFVIFISFSIVHVPFLCNTYNIVIKLLYGNSVSFLYIITNIFLFFYEEIVDFSLYWLYTYVCTMAGYKITKKDAYYTYEAPGHKECKLCRLHDPQDIDGGRLINGLSHFLPSGGGTEFGDNAMESIYYIVEGTMLFKGDDGVETVLEAGDSVHIAPHSKKCVTNIGTTTAQMLVVLLPEAAK